MLSDKALYDKIDRAVDLAYIPFIILMLGVDPNKADQREFSHTYQRRALLEVLYILLRNRPEGGWPAEWSLARLLDSVSEAHLPVLNDAQQATLDTARAAMLDSIETAKQEIKKQIRQRLVELNRQHRQDVAIKRVESVSQVEKRKQDLKTTLLKMIPLVMLATQDSFERSFTSALTDTVNDVAVDSATADSLFTGVPPGKIIVFKKVVDDSSLCRWCRKFYTMPDGSPKLYTLEQLQANGSNYGKPKSEWKPTIGKTHVRCRCQLFYRPR